MPSLYESTAIVGDVSSSNFTTLYNSSGLSAPNTGGGAVSGNLNVSGNLTVQGASLLQGAVVLGSTLSTPNYTFPLPDGTTDQVLVTDGSGNLYWTDVSAIPGAAYSIEANTATGGANLTLVDSAGGTDNVKFAGGTNITVSRTDANTITISTVADNIPDGTGKGQVLYWDGSAWTANSTITADNTTYRPRFVNNISGGVTAADLLKQYTGTLADGSAVGLLYGFYDGGAGSSTNPLYTHRLRSEYDTAGNNLFRIQADPVGNFGTSSTTVYSQLRVDNNSLDLNGNNILLGLNVSGAPTLDATLTVNRGSSTDAVLKWSEGNLRWEFTNALYVTGNYSQDGDSMTINADSTAVDSYLYLKGGSEYLKWNNTDTRFEFSDQIYNSQTDIPAIFERRNTTSEINTPLEFKSGLRLTQRITDAPDNDTLSAGPGITFTRTSGATATTERLFASLGAVWKGATQTVDWGFNWTNDDFSEPTPGNFPGTYRLLRLGSNNSEFFNNSIYINYSAQGPTNTATSITGSNTLVFGSAHGYNVGDRIQYTSTTQNGLTQNAYYYVIASGFTTTQCQLGLTSTGSAIALTNGTGLTLVFADLINQIGINTDTPAYTLDVNGDAHVSGNAYIDGNIETAGITAGNITVGVVNDNTISTISGGLDITALSGQDVTISATLAADPVTIVRNTAVTNSSVRSLTLRSVSTGTPAAGFGSSLQWQVENASNAIKDAAYINIASTNLTAGTESFTMGFGLMQNGAAYTDKMVLDDAGNLQIDNNLQIDGTTLTLNGDGTGTEDVTIRVERGVSPDATIIWNETLDRWEVSNDLYAPQATIGVIDINRTTGQIDTNSGSNLTLDSDGGTVFVNDNLNVDAGVLYVDAASNEVGINTITPAYPLDVNGTINTNTAVLSPQLTLDGRATFDTTTATTTSTTQFTLDSTARNAIKAMVYIESGTDSHVLEILIMRTSASAMMTTYGEMYTTSPLATFTADQSGGNIRIRCTPTSATSTTFSTVRYSLT